MKTLLAALFLAAALPAAAQDVRAIDRDRLHGLQGTLIRTLAEAHASGAPADVRLLDQALSGTPGALSPAGEWSCRTFKLGGLAPLIAYPSFRCRITEEGLGTWRIEKLTGSQRLRGVIRAEDERAIYLGVGYVQGGPAQSYEDFPGHEQTTSEPGQTFPQVGVFEQVDSGHARLLLPQPILESEFDILWLTR